MASSEDGDVVLMDAFRVVGIDIPQDVKTVKELSADLMVMILAKSLYLISGGDIVAPAKLPSNIAARHRVCTDLAEKIKVLGLPVKCGYNEILYPVEAASRAMLHWIVNKLPSNDDNAGDEVISEDALSRQRTHKALVAWKRKPWLLPLCSYGPPPRGIHKRNVFRTGPGMVMREKSLATLYAWTSKARVPMSHSLLELHAQQCASETAADESLDLDSAERRAQERARTRTVLAAGKEGYRGRAGKDGRDLTFDELVASVCDHVRGDGSSRRTRFEHAAEYAEESSRGVVSDGTSYGATGAGNESETPEQRRQRLEQEAADKRSAEVDALKQLVTDEAARLAALQAAKASVDEAAKAAADALASEGGGGGDDGGVAALEDDIRLKREALAMLPRAEENMAKMEAICLQSETKLADLQKQWEAYNAGMQKQLDDARGATEDRRRRCAEMIAEYRELREKTQELIADKKNKQKMAQMLLKELERLPNIDRALYTDRIMDIMRQIQKQDEQIVDMVADIRATQKAINTSVGGIQRADSVAEEKVYSRASRQHYGGGKSSIEAYRSLKDLRVAFEQLSQTVLGIGEQDRVKADMEVKIEQEEARINLNNFDRIKADLANIRAQNKTMFAQIQSLKAKK